MVFYNNGRFQIGMVSFRIPDGVYLDTEFEQEIIEGFEILDKDQLFRIVLRSETWEENAFDFFTKYVIEQEYDALGELQPFNINGLHGYKMWYVGCNRNYFEFRFDMPKGNGFPCFSIIIKCRKGTADAKDLENVEILQRLLASIRIE